MSDVTSLDDEQQPSSSHSSLAADHLAELTESAVPQEIAAVAGVFTAHTADQLPKGAEWVARVDGALPALVYPMREIDGSETWQLKPQPGSVTAQDGRVLKYVGPSKKSGVPSPQLPFVGIRRADGTVSTDPVDAKAAKILLIVEGCKQALAALSHAAKGVAVYRITGVWSWRVAGEGDEPGAPTPYLPAVVQGKEVVILGDVDAATNIAVFDGLTALGEAVKAAGAKSVKFAVIAGKAKQGVDDVLAALDGDEARRSALAGWIAKAAAKPAALSKTQQDQLRKALRHKEAERRLRETADPDRVDHALMGDWHEDCTAIAKIVSDALGGSVLFQRSTAVELVDGDDGPALRKMANDDVHRRTLSAVRLVGLDFCGNPAVKPGLPRDAVGILRGHLTPLLPRVSRISRTVVVRGDGTIVSQSGFDPETGVLLILDPVIENLRVPEHPTDDDISEAVHLLRDVLFERDLADGYDGWAFQAETDRTSALALLLTTLLRSGFPVAPLFLLDGLQSRIGKGEVLQTVHRIAYGGDARTPAAPSTDDEMEKRFTADLLAGKSFIVLDEVMGDDGRCRLRSPSLNAVLAGPVWGGRKLGRSESVTLRQDATWVATGNKVDLPGDIANRTVTIRLSSDREKIADRDNFRHRLDEWVPAHRRELLTAAVLLVRAWYDRGQPEAPRVFGFTGFGQWQRTVGGILHMAGIEDFLVGTAATRATADSEANDNHAHLEWVLRATAGLAGAPRFTAKEVVLLAAADPDAVSPYDRKLREMDTRALGKMWKGIAGRWLGGLRIVEDGFAHGNVRAWRVERSATSGAPTPRPGPQPAPALETMRVKDRHGRVTEHLRVVPDSDGVSLDDLAGGAAHA